MSKQLSSSVREVKVKNSKDHIMETKKISFGFNKVTKKTEIVSKASKASNSVELIDCLEDQSIKVKKYATKSVVMFTFVFIVLIFLVPVKRLMSC
jgi:hypothetical protein